MFLNRRTFLKTATATQQTRGNEHENYNSFLHKQENGTDPISKIYLAESIIVLFVSVRHICIITFLLANNTLWWIDKIIATYASYYIHLTQLPLKTMSAFLNEPFFR